MKVLSVWAFHHKIAARLCFVFIYLALNLVCLFFNEVLLEQNVEVPLYISYVLCSLFLIAALLYPSRKQKHAYKNFYGFQKTMDGVLFSLSFLLIVLTMNASSSGKLLFGGGNAWAAESAIKPVKPFYKVKVQAKGAA
ncbi:MAG TPA: hypothetical protein VM935_00270, partial [Chitinophagaceae bacterium]|nr:hypothetical protein [Chitinophagaceae bacterium]